jgi:hypothetical protein
MLANLDLGLAHARLGKGIEEAGEQISERGHGVISFDCVVRDTLRTELSYFAVQNTLIASQKKQVSLHDSSACGA